MKLKNFEYIQIKESGREINGGFLIEELDKDMKIYRVIELIHPKNNKGKFKLIDSTLGTRKEDLGEDEKHIFPNGRSRSKYKNAIEVYNYYGMKYLNCEFTEFDSEVFFLEDLTHRTGITAHEILPEKYKKYHENLLEDLYDNNKKIIDIKDYVTFGQLKEFNHKKIASFILELIFSVRTQYITEVKWGISGEEGRLLVLKVRDKEVIIRGLEMGSFDKDCKFTKACLEYLGFDRGTERVMSEKNGKIKK